MTKTIEIKKGEVTGKLHIIRTLLKELPSNLMYKEVDNSFMFPVTRTKAKKDFKITITIE